MKQQLSTPPIAAPPPPPPSQLPSSAFRDQVALVTGWFATWSECEQTVAVFTLLRRLASASPTQLRFLQRSLDQLLATADWADRLLLLESQANDAEYVRNLMTTAASCTTTSTTMDMDGGITEDNTAATAVSQLISNLLLLRPGNDETKAQYMKALPALLGVGGGYQQQVSPSTTAEDAGQLLSYSLMHPALSAADKAQVKSWLWQLEDRCSCDNSSMPLCNGDISPPIPPYNNGYVSSGLGVMTGGNSSQTSAAAPAATTSLPPPPLPHMPPMLFPGGQSLYSVPPPPPAPFVSAPPFGRSLSCDDYDSRSSSSGSSNGSGNGINRATTKYPSMLHPPLKVSISAQQQQQQTSDTGYPLRGSVSSYTTQPPVVPAVHPTAGLTLQTCHSPGNGGMLTPGFRKLVRSASDVQPSPSSLRGSRGLCDWYQRGSSLAVNIKSGTSTPDTGHQSLSPENSSSGCDTGPEDFSPRNVFVDEASGMREVPIWLKGLRLHKYAHLFQTMTYEQMLDVDETWLETQNVTKGARNKILLSLKKLKERQGQLRGIEKEILEGGNIRQALSDIRNILGTPLKAYQGGTGVIVAPPLSSSDLDTVPEGDLPGQLTRTLGKVCTQLLVTKDVEDDCHHCYIQLLDKCVQHISAFTRDQKRKMSSWRQQVVQMMPHNNRYANGLLRRGNYCSQMAMSGLHPRPLRGQVVPMPPSQHTRWTFTGLPANTSIPPPSVLNPTLPQSGSYPIPATIPPPPPPSALPLHGMETKRTLCHTRSAPLSSDYHRMSYATDMMNGDSELNARLDDLCLSMTNHALEGSFDVFDQCATY